MKCYNCDTSISDKYLLCKSCAFDPKVGISLKEVKKRYKLTEEELDEADLFCLSYSYKGYNCKKYLVSEVKNLRKKLKALNPKDKKRIAHPKKRNFRSDDKKDKEEQMFKKEKIKEYVKAFLLKLESSFTIDSPEVIQLIYKYSQYVSLSILDASNCVYDDMILVKEAKDKEMQAMERLDRLIEDKIGKEYMSDAKNHYSYKRYLKGEMDIEKCLSNLLSYSDQVQQKRNMDNWKKKNDYYAKQYKFLDD